jgi:hypothetical protein
VLDLKVLKCKWSEVMAIEIKDLNLVTEVQESQSEVLDPSTSSEVRGGYNPYDDPYYAAHMKVDANQSKPSASNSPSPLSLIPYTGFLLR